MNGSGFSGFSIDADVLIQRGVLLSSILSSIRKSTHWRRIDGQIWAVYLRKWPFRIDAVYALEACLFHDHRPCASPPSTLSSRAAYVTV
jgi:hypothetical protein